MVGLVILGIVLVFLAVLVVRALMFTPKPQPQTDSTPVDFDKDAAVLLYDGLLCKVKTVQMVAFMVYLTFGRVYIFCGFCIVLQYTTSECNDFS